MKKRSRSLAAPKRDVAGSYPGGKAGAGVYQRIISLIPKHGMLVSAFAGHCAIVRHIKPALPDVFRIIVPLQLILNERKHLMRPVFYGYKCEERKTVDRVELTYTKVHEKKQNVSVQDLIIARFKEST